MVKKLTLLLLLVLTSVLLGPFYASAGVVGEPEGLTPRQRIAVLDFQTLNEAGEFIDPVSVEQTDLVTLSRTLALSVGARMVQYGQFAVHDAASLRQSLGQLPYAADAPAYERARILLVNYGFDQVITGSVTMLQSTAIVGIQRFQIVDGEPQLVGSAMGQAARLQDAPDQVDTLMADLFPADVQVIERAIEQVFVIPGQVRLNLGEKRQIQAYALDGLGRPIADPSFLFLSHDESKVSIDEQGRVTGLQPGSAKLSVRAISQTARSGPPAEVTVTVVPPALGIRAGSLLTDRAGVDGYPVRFGLRLTPSFDQPSSASLPDMPDAAPVDSSNPLSFISSFFSTLLTNGLVTIDVDFEPTQEMLFAFTGVQRSLSGYVGTGVGYIASLDDDAASGFLLRFTVGTQLQSFSRVSLPAEATLDLVFPSDDASLGFRVGVNVGLDLFP